MKKLRFLYKLILFSAICFTVIITALYIYAYLSPKIVLNSANSIILYDQNEEVVFASNNSNSWVSKD